MAKSGKPLNPYYQGPASDHFNGTRFFNPDGIPREVSRIQKDLGSKDRSRLNTYLESVREIERRIEKIEQHNASNANRELPSAPIGKPRAQMESQFDPPPS